MVSLKIIPLTDKERVLKKIHFIIILEMQFFTCLRFISPGSFIISPDYITLYYTTLGLQGLTVIFLISYSYEGGGGLYTQE